MALTGAARIADAARPRADLRTQFAQNFRMTHYPLQRPHPPTSTGSGAGLPPGFPRASLRAVRVLAGDGGHKAEKSRGRQLTTLSRVSAAEFRVPERRSARRARSEERARRALGTGPDGSYSSSSAVLKR